MSLYDDSTLKRYQNDYNKLVKDQSDYSTELARLRMRREAELENVERSYRREIADTEKGLATTTRMLPESQRRVESRQRELQRELEKSAANTNSAPQAQRSGWLR